MSILTQYFNTKHNTAPFSQIKIEDYVPAFNEGIALAKAEIDAIVNNPDVPTFENTIVAMDYSGDILDRLSSIFFNLNSAETNDEMQKIAQEVSPLLSEFGNDIRLNADLFARVKAVYDQKESLNLNPEQTTLLDKKYKSFSRNGANLPEDKKNQLREIDKELSKLSLQFGENVLAETNNFELHLTDEKDLSGLPEGTIEAARLLAKNQEKEGWIFTLDHPSYIPFLTYADNRELRKKMAIAFGAKAFQNNEFNNEENVLKIAKLRHERANLLGYKTHAHFVLEERMAESPEKVFSFLNDLLAKAKPAAQKEFAELTAFAKELDGIEQLEKWDGAYYSEKLKQQLFNLDDEKLKPYFQLEKVLDGAFTVAKKLYGLTFTEVFDIDKYHEEVTTYEVKDANDNLVSIFYADFFPRKGKRNGAWMTSFKSQYVKDGVNERPHISNVCNFTKPTETKPSLLTFNEVTTLFHEFGHGLHGMLADTVYPSLSGTSVYWDFVELPSQIMENWCYEPEALALFANHYETGEIIPIEYVQKIKESASFQEGLATLRQLSFGLLDMAWHGQDPTNITDLKAFETEQFANTQLYPDVKENAMSTAFSHIFQGGYSSGYYSYKWAEVLDADAFEYFHENGIFNEEIAKKFKDNVLSKGGTEHPMTLYKRFRGQEPKPEALLKRAGLL
ncbi:M3 family metallopeptidase [Flavobacterium johnsoniae]|uniref:Peptidase family M3 Oligopeptidase A n=1 Tax=Flavobacterium johnsoniae (strain ATCC 17061 / DSM 2064 / JCM 8514 / BCRC 14874 / CCUG 350202 / NBRC 14942 / NCIMB 11054 / UW101) TaxID=376686 RepID=A5FMU9_FLAJ1|nr:M3 family metallopeptidase [Flavobacterium johnsoniae]ABQ03465.1 Peptidase family M3; Oligopeptidase A [Flavobacterium johnsoniae UW101]OXG01120.1 peptidase M3 [Flavobacterium johnsoniae UW101]WQG79671.1 M3 family metallopeptidase [Flavobacterium johnsoniae UW101]SHL74368.1 peptidyl-dipeptidase Dcp [Flavobacterium johnsoniae]